MAHSDQHEAQQAVAAVKSFVRALGLAARSLQLYPPSSDIPRGALEAAVMACHEAVAANGPVSIQVTRDGLEYAGERLLPSSATFVSFERGAYARRLAEIVFHPTCTRPDIEVFLALLDRAPTELASQGGLGAALEAAGITSITVSLATLNVVGDAQAEAADLGQDTARDAPWPPSADLIREVIEAGSDRSPRIARTLVRVLGDPAVLGAYLTQHTEGGTASEDAELGIRITRAAHAIARTEDPAGRLKRSLAHAIFMLDPTTRGRVLSEQLLHEARHDADLAAGVGAMGLDAVLDAILAGLPESPATRLTLSKAIRDLTMLGSMGGPESVLASAREGMTLAGFGEQFTADVLTGATPRPFMASPTGQIDEGRSGDNVTRLLDIPAPWNVAIGQDDAYAALRAEADRGLTDGDVQRTLLSMALIEQRQEPFDVIASLLGDGLALLLDSHEFEAAADIAETLVATVRDPATGAHRAKRAAELLGRLSHPAALRAVVAALRFSRDDSPEHVACHRLLDALRDQAVAPLLELLADEDDMAARKAMIELISAASATHLAELGNRLDDGRWYFVRNLVSILGATRDPAALPYLQRVVRHDDARVRREVIRALTAIADPRTEDMLVSALVDDDPANMQASILALGVLGSLRAAPALERIAQGDGMGARDMAVRLNAIEAIGRIGAPSSVALLESLAKRRTLFRRVRARRLRAAAQAALARIAEGLPGKVATDA